MKKIFAVLLLLFFSACEKDINSSYFPSEKIPTQILLQNKNFEPAGIAIPIYKDIFATSNSVFKKDEKFFWQKEEAEIMIRDFSTDLIFFELGNNVFFPTKLSDTPPAVGEILFRFADGEILESKILSMADDTDKFTAFGEMNAQKDLGAPIFDKSGKIYGIFIGGNTENSTLVFLRSDKILELFKEGFNVSNTKSI